MRTLKFNVKGQILRADEKCNFENIVAGSIYGSYAKYKIGILLMFCI